MRIERGRVKGKNHRGHVSRKEGLRPRVDVIVSPCHVGKA